VKGPTFFQPCKVPFLRRGAFLLYITVRSPGARPIGNTTPPPALYICHWTTGSASDRQLRFLNGLVSLLTLRVSCFDFFDTSFFDARCRTAKPSLDLTPPAVYFYPSPRRAVPENVYLLRLSSSFRPTPLTWLACLLLLNYVTSVAPLGLALLSFFAI